MIGWPPLCTNCKHFHNVPEDSDIMGFTCDAFPDGIPNSIIMNSFDHHVTNGEDSGIVYESEGPMPDEIEEARREDGLPLYNQTSEEYKKVKGIELNRKPLADEDYLELNDDNEWVE